MATLISKSLTKAISRAMISKTITADYIMKLLY